MSAAGDAGRRAARPRTPDRTRRLLLDCAYREIHRHGFQAASLNAILSAAGVTKGALYHHFEDKRALGLAVLDEVVSPELRAHWIEPLADTSRNPVDTLIGVIRASGDALTLEDILVGCPLNNLAQEMSPIDEGFRTRIEAIYGEWRWALVTAFDTARERGWVRPTLDSEALAAFVVASLEGCIGTAKNAQSREVLLCCGKGLIDYLESVRA